MRWYLLPVWVRKTLCAASAVNAWEPAVCAASGAAAMNPTLRVIHSAAHMAVEMTDLKSFMQRAFHAGVFPTMITSIVPIESVGCDLLCLHCAKAPNR